MAERVTDEQLDEWAADGLVCSLHAIHSGHINALIGEVRASRAREAELRSEVDTARMMKNDLALQFVEQGHRLIAAEVERDLLQQRIDKALELLHAAENDPVYLACSRNFDGSRSPALVHTDRVRAALTGTGDKQ